MLYSKFISCNCEFSKLWCRLGEEFPTLSKRAFEVIIPFQNNCHVWGRVLLNDDHKTKHRSRLVPTSQRHSITAPRMSDIARKKSRKVSLSVYMVEIGCHFSVEEKFKHGWIFLLPNVFPLDSVIRRIAGSYENVFRISTTSANHVLKVFMLACKSILIKFRLRGW